MNPIRYFQGDFIRIAACFCCCLIFVGCETTDYEPLIMKKKLRELEAQIQSSKGSSPVEIPTDLVERIDNLEKVVAELKKDNLNLKNLLEKAAREKEKALLVELESLGAFVDLNSDGFAETVDLREE